MRITKEADVRKAEILDAAEKLFHEKGYAKATTEDILKIIGIARGTLYYHFKSKEDILLAIIERQIDRREKEFRCIAENEELSAVEKLVQVIHIQFDNGILAEGLHEKENAEFHQKSFQRSILRFTPVLTEIVEQGIRNGEFSCAYPKEYVEMLFCASQLFDPGVFLWSQAERQQKKEAFFCMLEAVLGISNNAEKKLYQAADISMIPEENNNECK